MAGVKYGPYKNWGKKKSIVLFRNRQYTLKEKTKWTNLGRFAIGMPEAHRLEEAAKSAMNMTQLAYDSDKSAFTWLRTQEGLV